MTSQKLLCLAFIFLCSFYKVYTAEDDGDDRFWVCIENINIFNCTGVENQVDVDKKDISLTDKAGKKIYVAEGPGDYVLSIKNIRAKKALPNMAGQVAAILQVPLIQGVLGSKQSWDVPYQVLPQKKLIQGAACDNESAMIEDNGKKQWCRYCDLCNSANDAEKVLANGKHKFLPGVSEGSEESLSKTCTKVSATSYNTKVSLRIPGEKEMKDDIKQEYKGKVDSNAEQKLEKGKGKLQMNMILMSDAQLSETQDAYNKRVSKCNCCVRDASGNVNCQPSKIGSLFSGLTGGLVQAPNTCAQCANEYAKTCFKNEPPKAACLTIEFNFKLLTDQNEAEQCRREQEEKDRKENGAGASNTNNQAQAAPATTKAPQKAAKSEEQIKQECINAITNSFYKNVCKNNWNKQRCCKVDGCAQKNLC